MSRHPPALPSIHDLRVALRVVRALRGDTVRQVGERVGISAATVCRFEGGDKSIEATHLWRLLDYLGARK